MMQLPAHIELFLNSVDKWTNKYRVNFLLFFGSDIIRLINNFISAFGFIYEWTKTSVVCSFLSCAYDVTAVSCVYFLFYRFIFRLTNWHRIGLDRSRSDYTVYLLMIIFRRYAEWLCKIQVNLNKSLIWIRYLKCNYLRSDASCLCGFKLNQHGNVYFFLLSDLNLLFNC